MEDAKEPGKGAAAASGSGGTAAAAAGEEEVDDDESEAAAAAMSEAFEKLIGAAFEMVQQGKPMEAEYVLAEGEPRRRVLPNRCFVVPLLPPPAMPPHPAPIDESHWLAAPFIGVCAA
jgi:hypothetical protein